MSRRLLLSGLLLTSLLTAGCSAFTVSTSEGDSAPVKVGVGSKQGQTPSAAAPTVPPGMDEVAVDIGPTCPTSISVAIDDEWNQPIGYDGYRLYERTNGALMTVNCYENDDVTPSDIVDEGTGTIFASSGSTLRSSSSGTLPGGEYMTFTGTIGADDVRAIESTESSIFGAVAGVQVEGRLFKITVEMVVKSDDQATADVFAQMLPTLQIGGAALTPPPALS